MMRIGFAGLGQMGAAMAARVAAARFPLAVMDIDADAVARFTVAVDADVAADAERLAEGRDVIITMLPDGAAVSQAIMDGAAAALPSLRPGTVVIDMSSSAPHDTIRLGARLAEADVELLDAPVSGGVKRAREGTLTIMAGGSSRLIATMEPLLSTMGSTVVAGGLGAGHAAKALNNSVSAAGLLAACEGLIIGKRFGIEPQALLEILNSSTGRNNATENKLAQFVLSRSFDSGFALDLLAKDLRIARDLARELGVQDDFTELAVRAITDAGAWLEDGADHTRVAAFLEHRSGTDLVDGAVPDASGALR